MSTNKPTKSMEEIEEEYLKDIAACDRKMLSLYHIPEGKQQKVQSEIEEMRTKAHEKYLASLKEHGHELPSMPEAIINRDVYGNYE